MKRSANLNTPVSGNEYFSSIVEATVPAMGIMSPYELVPRDKLMQPRVFFGDLLWNWYPATEEAVFEAFSIVGFANHDSIVALLGGQEQLGRRFAAPQQVEYLIRNERDKNKGILSRDMESSNYFLARGINCSLVYLSFESPENFTRVKTTFSSVMIVAENEKCRLFAPKLF
ncbi:MAG: hypothetical protein V4478_01660 [Patescibacteria group bacterium]